jgi:cell shape-determining protein MreD
VRNLLRAVLVVVSALALQAGLGRVWPAADRFVDVLLVPVVLYGVASPQRAAMFLGCAAGLLRDAWFQVGVFGLNGFKRTLLGWLLAGVASRVHLDHGPGRLVAGVLVSAGDSLLDLALRHMLEQRPQIDLVGLLVRAAVTGLLSVVLGSILDRVGDTAAVRHAA